MFSTKRGVPAEVTAPPVVLGGGVVLAPADARCKVVEEDVVVLVCVSEKSIIQSIRQYHKIHYKTKLFILDSACFAPST